MNHLHSVVRRAIRRRTLPERLASINEAADHGADPAKIAEALQSFASAQPATRRDGENALRALEIILHIIAGPPRSQPPHQEL